jgi:hypothetical protein
MRFRYVFALGLAVTAATLLPGVAVHAQQGDGQARDAEPQPATSSTQTVSFRIEPVILLVVGSDGQPQQLWTNLQRDPTASELAAVRVRIGGLDGPDIAVTPALQETAARIAGSVAWGRPGLVWSTS